MRIITATANNVGARPGSECVEGLEPSTPSWSQSPTQPLPREKVWGWQSQGPTTGQPAFSQSASGGAREGPTQSCRSPEDPVAAGRPGFAPVPKRRELAKGTSWKKCWCLPSPDTLPSNYTSLQVPCEKIMGANSSGHPKNKRHHKGPSQDADLNVYLNIWCESWKLTKMASSEQGICGPWLRPSFRCSCFGSRSIYWAPTRCHAL